MYTHTLQGISSLAGSSDQKVELAVVRLVPRDVGRQLLEAGLDHRRGRGRVVRREKVLRHHRMP